MNKKIWHSISFTFVLFIGISIIGIGTEYIDTAINNPMAISNGFLSIKSIGIIVIISGAFLLLFLISHSNFEISLISLGFSTITLVILFLIWEALDSFGSQLTYSSLDFNVILISFLLFWNINIFKNLFESKY